MGNFYPLYLTKTKVQPFLNFYFIFIFSNKFYFLFSVMLCSHNDQNYTSIQTCIFDEKERYPAQGCIRIFKVLNSTTERTHTTHLSKNSLKLINLIVITYIYLV